MTSVWRVRSCTSSNITTSYFLRRGSVRASRRSIPSVTYLKSYKQKGKKKTLTLFSNWFAPQNAPNNQLLHRNLRPFRLQHALPRWLLQLDEVGYKQCGEHDPSWSVINVTKSPIVLNRNWMLLEESESFFHFQSLLQQSTRNSSWKLLQKYPMTQKQGEHVENAKYQNNVSKVHVDLMDWVLTRR